jgi:hypothetical protein
MLNYSFCLFVTFKFCFIERLPALQYYGCLHKPLVTFYVAIPASPPIGMSKTIARVWYDNFIIDITNNITTFGLLRTFCFRNRTRRIFCRITGGEVNYNNIESVLMQDPLFLYQAEDHSSCWFAADSTAAVVVA